MWGCVVSGAWAYIEGVCYEVDWEGVDGGGGVDFGRYVRPSSYVLYTYFVFGVGMLCANRVCCCRVAGGVGTLSYEHHSVNEPAIL